MSEAAENIELRLITKEKFIEQLLAKNYDFSNRIFDFNLMEVFSKIYSEETGKNWHEEYAISSKNWRGENSIFVFEYDVNFSNTEFHKNTNFIGIKFSRNANFNGVKIFGYANFSDTEFLGNTFLFNAIFFQGSDFNRVNFKNVFFSGANLLLSTGFINTTFLGDANFHKTEFPEKADFKDAKFFTNANFREAKFYGDANFRETEFPHAYFSGAKFSKNAIFYGSIFPGYADFTGAIFSGDATFDRSKFSIYANFKDAIFFEDATFKGSKFSGYADFSKVEFFKEAVFQEAEFSKFVNFSKAKSFGSAIFNNVSLNDTTFFLKKTSINFLDLSNSFDRYFALITDGLKIKKAPRSVFTLFKKKLHEQQDYIESKRFYALEMREKWRDLTKDVKFYKPDWWLILLNNLSNKHGTSWIRGVFFTMIVSFISMLLLARCNDWQFDCSKEGIGFCLSYFSNIFDIASLFSKDKMYSVNFHDNDSYSVWLHIPYLLFRIFTYYGVYQTIAAFRKYKM